MDWSALMTRTASVDITLRDLLMWLALSGAFRTRWSAQIHDEWKRNLLENRPDLTSEQIDRTIVMLNDAVSGAVVTEYEFLVEGLVLPDLDDRHALAVTMLGCGFDHGNASAVHEPREAMLPSRSVGIIHRQRQTLNGDRLQGVSEIFPYRDLRLPGHLGGRTAYHL
jgi:hypothetical protein